MANKKVVFDPLQHLNLFNDISTYTGGELSSNVIQVSSKKKYTEADIEELWNHFHSPGVRVDGLVDSYEDFKNMMLSQG